MILCGQNSLYIFCLGILLSYLGHLVLVEISRAIIWQFAVSAGGILIMIGCAQFLTWAKRQTRANDGGRVLAVRGLTAPQGGE